MLQQSAIELVDIDPARVAGRCATSTDRGWPSILGTAVGLDQRAANAVGLRTSTCEDWQSSADESAITCGQAALVVEVVVGEDTALAIAARASTDLPVSFSAIPSRPRWRPVEGLRQALGALRAVIDDVAAAWPDASPGRRRPGSLMLSVGTRPRFYRAW